MSEFVNKLIENSKADIYPMHMPGHKRRTLKPEPDDAISQIRAIDITEIEGFDNLNMPEGIIRDMEKRTAAVFRSPHSILTVNGSTCGVLAAVTACVKRGGRLLMARNCHRCAYSAAYLNGLKTSYIYPEIIDGLGINGGITPAAVRRGIADDPDVQAVLITSPTYEGVISDIEGIARVVHDYGIPLIVDEAHGAHFGLYEPFSEKYGMESSINRGADIVIQSLHKTLPSFTQTAVIHYSDDNIDPDRLRRCVASYQSSSPSYILMAGIDRCLDIIEAGSGQLFEDYEHNLEMFYEKAGELKILKLINPVSLVNRFGVAGFDVGKLVIMAPGGKGLFETLIHEYGIHAEMYGSNYIVAMTSIMDNQPAFDRFFEALKKCDELLFSGEESSELSIGPAIERIRPAAVMTISEALDGASGAGVNCDPEMICRNFVYAYPPGVPVLVPGELYGKEIFALFDRLNDSGVQMKYL